MTKTSPTVMIVAGEASGDGHAAKLVNEFRKLAPKAEFFGSAGPKMREASVAATVKADDLSIVGLAEIGRALPMFMRTMKKLRAVAEEKKPDVAILVDFPDFNLKLAKHLSRKGIKVVYYISPQLWAWRKYRISTIRKYVDLLITILPFEKDWYEHHGVTHVEYVGSPLAREVHSNISKVDLCSANSIDPARQIVALLPGSRSKEITRILPVMLAAAEKLKKDHDIQFVIAASSDEQAVRLRKRKDVTDIKIIAGHTYDILNAADAAAVTSGTATLETGIIGTPLVIVYKTSKVNYSLLEPMIDVPHYGLINLIAGERLAKELIQDEFTANTLAVELSRLLEPEVNREMRGRLKIATDKLGHGGASKRAAEAILVLIEKD